MAYNMYAEKAETAAHSLAFAAQDLSTFHLSDTPERLFEIAQRAHAKVAEANRLVAELKLAVDDHIRDQEHRVGRTRHGQGH